MAFFKQIQTASLRGAYWLCGPEFYVREQALRQALTLAGEMGALNVHQLRAPDPNALGAVAESLPFLGERNIVIVRDFDVKLADVLRAYLPTLPDSTLLLFVSEDDAPAKGSVLFRLFALGECLVPDPDAAARKKPKLVAKILPENADHLVCFEPLGDARAEAFLQKLAKQRGVTLSAPLGKTLIGMVGHGASNLKNEFDKAADYVGADGTITKDVLDKVVSPTAEYGNFALDNALWQRDMAAALRIYLQGVADKTQPPMLVLGLALSKVRAQIAISEALEQGLPDAQICRITGISSGMLYHKKRAAKDFPSPLCRRMLLRLIRADEEIKTGVQSDRDAVLLALLDCFSKPETGAASVKTVG